jgi:hypothetical protein
MLKNADNPWHWATVAVLVAGIVAAGIWAPPGVWQALAVALGDRLVGATRKRGQK